MTVERVVRPGHRALAQLRMVVDSARAEVVRVRREEHPSRNALVRAQRNLLAALETYVRALEAAGLAPHPQMRAEVALLRSVTTAGGKTT